jgi:hypothetical protein
MSTANRPLAIITGASSGSGKVQAAVANITPASILAEQHRKLAAPGSGQKSGIDPT